MDFSIANIILTHFFWVGIFRNPGVIQTQISPKYMKTEGFEGALIMSQLIHHNDVFWGPNTKIFSFSK